MAGDKIKLKTKINKKQLRSILFELGDLFHLCPNIMFFFVIFFACLNVFLFRTLGFLEKIKNKYF